jgi:hypothetical protein
LFDWNRLLVLLFKHVAYVCLQDCDAFLCLRKSLNIKYSLIYFTGKVILITVHRSISKDRDMNFDLFMMLFKFCNFFIFGITMLIILILNKFDQRNVLESYIFIRKALLIKLDHLFRRNMHNFLIYLSLLFRKHQIKKIFHPCNAHSLHRVVPERFL